MKKKAGELKKGDKVVIAGKSWLVEEVEISDIGKQGTKKCRIVASDGQNKNVIVRPEDYPLETA